jgi:hypothetical protein
MVYSLAVTLREFGSRAKTPKIVGGSFHVGFATFGHQDP